MKRFTVLDKIRGIFDQRYSKKVSKRAVYESAVRGKTGLEIGGPSRIFTDKGNLPLYHLSAHLDGVNYSASTVWNEEMKEGAGNYLYGEGKSGQQYIQEASDLSKIKSGKYDFLLASHCLEHCANPLKTVNEWMRVVKDDGYLLIVLPHKEGTFDHRRPVTPLEHMIDDFNRDIGEADLTALDEVLHLHDFSMDKASGTFEFFKARSLKNMENRCLHHHVFNGLNAAQLLDRAGLKIVDAQMRRPYHIVFLTQKVKSRPDNDSYLHAESYKSVGPFGS